MYVFSIPHSLTLHPLLTTNPGTVVQLNMSSSSVPDQQVSVHMLAFSEVEGPKELGTHAHMVTSRVADAEPLRETKRQIMDAWCTQTLQQIKNGQGVAGQKHVHMHSRVAKLQLPSRYADEFDRSSAAMGAMALEKGSVHRAEGFIPVSSYGAHLHTEAEGKSLDAVARNFEGKPAKVDEGMREFVRYAQLAAGGYTSLRGSKMQKMLMEESYVIGTDRSGSHVYDTTLTEESENALGVAFNGSRFIGAGVSNAMWGENDEGQMGPWTSAAAQNYARGQTKAGDWFLNKGYDSQPLEYTEDRKEVTASELQAKINECWSATFPTVQALVEAHAEAVTQLQDWIEDADLEKADQILRILAPVSLNADGISSAVDPKPDMSSEYHAVPWSALQQHIPNDTPCTLPFGEKPVTSGFNLEVSKKNMLPQWLRGEDKEIDGDKATTVFYTLALLCQRGLVGTTITVETMTSRLATVKNEYVEIEEGSARALLGAMDSELGQNPEWERKIMDFAFHDTELTTLQKIQILHETWAPRLKQQFGLKMTLNEESKSEVVLGRSEPIPGKASVKVGGEWYALPDVTVTFKNPKAVVQTIGIQTVRIHALVHMLEKEAFNNENAAAAFGSHEVAVALTGQTFWRRNRTKILVGLGAVALAAGAALAYKYFTDSTWEDMWNLAVAGAEQARTLAVTLYQSGLAGLKDVIQFCVDSINQIDWTWLYDMMDAVKNSQAAKFAGQMFMLSTKWVVHAAQVTADVTADAWAALMDCPRVQFIVVQAKEAVGNLTWDTVKKTTALWANAAPGYVQDAIVSAASYVASLPGRIQEFTTAAIQRGQAFLLKDLPAFLGETLMYVVDDPVLGSIVNIQAALINALFSWETDDLMEAWGSAKFLARQLAISLLRSINKFGDKAGELTAEFVTKFSSMCGSLVSTGMQMLSAVTERVQDAWNSDSVQGMLTYVQDTMTSVMSTIVEHPAAKWMVAKGEAVGAVISGLIKSAVAYIPTETIAAGAASTVAWVKEAVEAAVEGVKKWVTETLASEWGQQYIQPAIDWTRGAVESVQETVSSARGSVMQLVEWAAELPARAEAAHDVSITDFRRMGGQGAIIKLFEKRVWPNTLMVLEKAGITITPKEAETVLTIPDIWTAGEDGIAELMKDTEHYRVEELERAVLLVVNKISQRGIDMATDVVEYGKGLLASATQSMMDAAVWAHSWTVEPGMAWASAHIKMLNDRVTDVKKWIVGTQTYQLLAEAWDQLRILKRELGASARAAWEAIDTSEKRQAIIDQVSAAVSEKYEEMKKALTDLMSSSDEVDNSKALVVYGEMQKYLEETEVEGMSYLDIITASAGKAAGSFMTGAAAASDAALRTASAVKDYAVEQFRAMVSGMPFLEDAWEGIAARYSVALEGIKAFPSYVKETWKSVAKQVQEIGDSIREQFYDDEAGKWDYDKVYTAARAKVASMYKAAVDWTKEQFNAACDYVAGMISTGLGVMYEAGHKAWEAVKRTARSIIKQLPKEVQDVMRFFVTSFKKLSGEQVEKFVEMPEELPFKENNFNALNNLICTEAMKGWMEAAGAAGNGTLLDAGAATLDTVDSDSVVESVVSRLSLDSVMGTDQTTAVAFAAGVLANAYKASLASASLGTLEMMNAGMYHLMWGGLKAATGVATSSVLGAVSVGGVAIATPFILKNLVTDRVPPSWICSVWGMKQLVGTKVDGRSWWDDIPTGDMCITPAIPSNFNAHDALNVPASKARAAVLHMQEQRFMGVRNAYNYVRSFFYYPSHRVAMKQAQDMAGGKASDADTARIGGAMLDEMAAGTDIGSFLDSQQLKMSLSSTGVGGDIVPGQGTEEARTTWVAQVNNERMAAGVLKNRPLMGVSTVLHATEKNIHAYEVLPDHVSNSIVLSGRVARHHDVIDGSRVQNTLLRKLSVNGSLLFANDDPFGEARTLKPFSYNQRGITVDRRAFGGKESLHHIWESSPSVDVDGIITPSVTSAATCFCSRDTNVLRPGAVNIGAYAQQLAASMGWRRGVLAVYRSNGQIIPHIVGASDPGTFALFLARCGIAPSADFSAIAREVATRASDNYGFGDMFCCTVVDVPSSARAPVYSTWTRSYKIFWNQKPYMSSFTEEQAKNV